MSRLKSNLILIKLTIALFFLTAGLFSCAEQPTGYIYRPTQRDEVAVSRLVENVVSSLYDNMDLSVGFLEDASHTNNYATILPAGWQAIPFVDTTSGAPYTLYFHNFLDQKYQSIRFDKNPLEGAVRMPSDIEYSFLKLRNFFNERSFEFYMDVDEYIHLVVEYSQNRNDPHHVEGWFDIKRAVEFEEEIQIGDYISTYEYYMYPTWVIRIEDFSTDALDHSARLIIEGTFPHRDEIDNFQNDHVTGDITMQANGTGSGEIRLYGKPISRVYFTSRGAGFEGYFTLYSQDHYWIHDF